MLFTIKGHGLCGVPTVAARGYYICALYPRHVRAPTGGRCQGEPDRGNVYVRWRPRSCAPKKGATVRRRPETQAYIYRLPTPSNIQFNTIVTDALSTML